MWNELESGGGERKMSTEGSPVVKNRRLKDQSMYTGWTLSDSPIVPGSCLLVQLGQRDAKTTTHRFGVPTA